MKFFSFCLAFLSITYLSAQTVVFEEHFDNNNKEWIIYNESTNQSKIAENRYEWIHRGDKAAFVGHYINRLNEQYDYSFEVVIDINKLGTQAGVIVGGVDKYDANFFLISNRKWKIIKTRKGKIAEETEYKLNLKIGGDKNLIKVTKEGSTLNYYINNSKIFSEPYTPLPGKVFGVSQWADGQIAFDDMVVKGKELPINIAKDMHYLEKPVNLGKAVNSNEDDITPVITPDGEGIYFSRRYYPQNVGGPSDVQDIYYSELTNGSWSTAQNMGTTLNNHGPNAVCSVTPDGNTLLLINTYYPDGKQKGQGLSISKRTKNGWTIPEELRINGFYNKSTYGEYFLSNDRRVLIMALQQDNSIGSRDLYISFLGPNNIWSKPKNMGSILNTPGTELSPFLASDGKTLYFSSTGHPGYGKNDIFVSKRLDESWTKWSKPYNLGKPINTEGWNAYYSVPADGDYAYYVSSENSMGKNDIFKIKLPSKVKPEPVVIIKGRVLNSKTKEPLGTDIIYRNFKTDREVGIASSDPRNGKYEIVLPLSQVYSFFAEKEGFYSVQDRLDLENVKAYDVIERDLYLTPIEVGQTVQLHNVLFKRGTPILLTPSYAELNKLVKMLKENESIDIRIDGHTDNVGDKDANVRLSQERVEAVKEYLSRRGIDPYRITGEGHGGAKPIASNAREETRRLNRRVEFTITSY